MEKVKKEIGAGRGNQRWWLPRKWWKKEKWKQDESEHHWQVVRYFELLKKSSRGLKGTGHKKASETKVETTLEISKDNKTRAITFLYIHMIEMAWRINETWWGEKSIAAAWKPHILVYLMNKVNMILPRHHIQIIKIFFLASLISTTRIGMALRQTYCHAAAGNESILFRKSFFFRWKE